MAASSRRAGISRARVPGACSTGWPVSAAVLLVCSANGKAASILVPSAGGLVRGYSAGPGDVVRWHGDQFQPRSPCLAGVALFVAGSMTAQAWSVWPSVRHWWQMSACRCSATIHEDVPSRGRGAGAGSARRADGERPIGVQLVSQRRPHGKVPVAELATWSLSLEPECESNHGVCGRAAGQRG